MLLPVTSLENGPILSLFCSQTFFFDETVFIFFYFWRDLELTNATNYNRSD